MTVTRPCGPHVGIDAAEAGIPCPTCGLGTPTPTDTEWLDEVERLRDDLIRVNAEYHGLLSDAEDERDALAARLAAVEEVTAWFADPVRAGFYTGAQVASRLRAALSAAPTDTTKETDR